MREGMESLGMYKGHGKGIDRKAKLFSRYYGK